MPNRGPIKLLDEITGTGFLRIQSTLPMMSQLPIMPEDVLFLVRHQNDRVIVVRECVGGSGPRKAVCIRDEAVIGLTDQEFADLVASGSVEKINGTSFLAVQSAAGVYLNRAPNTMLADYKIEVIAEGSSTAVIFRHKDTPARTKGGRGFEVELISADRSVISSNFLR